MKSSIKFILMIVLACLTVVFAEDWPQFLGPNRNGIGPDGEGLARSWPPGGPPVLWEVSVGEGFAGAAIVGGSVLILDRRDDRQDVLRRIRLPDGQQIWGSAYLAPGKLDRNGSRCSRASPWATDQVTSSPGISSPG